MTDKMCHFCERRAQWRYATPNIIEIILPTTEGLSLEEWFACPECARLIDGERWRELANIVSGHFKMDETETGQMMTLFRSGRHPKIPKQPLYKT